MLGRNLFRAIGLITGPFLLVACQSLDLASLKDAPTSFLSIGKKSGEMQKSFKSPTNDDNPMLMADILEGSLANNNNGSDFVSAVKYALDTDPLIISKRRDVEAKLAAVESTEAQKAFQVRTTLYGGIEDITDNTKGLAVSLNASRLVFDGGELESQIDSSQFVAEAAKMELMAALDMRAYELCLIWLELDKFKTLKAQIDQRLAVLNPLIGQLEQVAKAGIGDVSKVTAAQRTVAAIRVEQTNIAESFAQAQLEFSNAFGLVDKKVAFNHEFITKLVPKKIDYDLVQNSPLLLSKYAKYQSRVSSVRALRAKDAFSVGFEVQAMRPFAGSGYDSDESIGLVGRKTLFNGGMLESDIRRAEALVEASSADIRATFREGSSSVQTAEQNIESMDKSILRARENAKLTSDEIVYLRKQLVIGSSTLDSVLSAEARLYAAESKEIQFLTEKYKSELLIVSSLGLLSRSFGY